MKYKSAPIVAACVAAIVFTPAFSAFAKKKSESPTPAASASPSASPAKAARPIPFHGMISSVDAKAKTFTIAGKTSTRVFKITDKTEILKAGAPGKMNDIVANQEVSGSYWKAADGSLEAKKVKIGMAGDSEKKPKKSKEKASPSPTP